MKPQSAQRKTLCTPHFLQVESYILYHEFTMKKKGILVKDLT
jgi:hypothetical protein